MTTTIQTLFAIKIPFQSKNANGSKDIEFDVIFDVIEGDLPFFMGLPSLIAMGANLRLKHMTLSFSPHNKYRRLKLIKHGDHVCFPFVCHTIKLPSFKDATISEPTPVAYTIPGRAALHLISHAPEEVVKIITLPLQPHAKNSHYQRASTVRPKTTSAITSVTVTGNVQTNAL